MAKCIRPGAQALTPAAGWEHDAATSHAAPRRQRSSEVPDEGQSCGVDKPPWYPPSPGAAFCWRGPREARFAAASIRWTAASTWMVPEPLSHSSLAIGWSSSSAGGAWSRRVQRPTSAAVGLASARSAQDDREHEQEPRTEQPRPREQPEPSQSPRPASAHSAKRPMRGQAASTRHASRAAPKQCNGSEAARGRCHGRAQLLRMRKGQMLWQLAGLMAQLAAPARPLVAAGLRRSSPQRRCSCAASARQQARPRRTLRRSGKLDRWSPHSIWTLQSQRQMLHQSNHQQGMRLQRWKRPINRSPSLNGSLRSSINRHATIALHAAPGSLHGS